MSNQKVRFDSLLIPYLPTCYSDESKYLLFLPSHNFEETYISPWRTEKVTHVPVAHHMKVSKGQGLTRT